MKKTITLSKRLYVRLVTRSVDAENGGMIEANLRLGKLVIGLGFVTKYHPETKWFYIKREAYADGREHEFQIHAGRIRVGYLWADL